MAGDWIKVRTCLPGDGRLKISARKCHASVTPNELPLRYSGNASVTLMFGALVIMWSHADQHADPDGILVGYTAEDIDALVAVPGFCRSLPPDWMDLSGEWVKLPNYKAHNGSNAKKRALAMQRKRSQRERDSMEPNVTLGSLFDGDTGHKQIGTRVRVRVRSTPIAPKGTQDVVVSPALLRARKLFRMLDSTPLDTAQDRAWKKNRGVLEAATEEQWQALEWLYSLKEEPDEKLYRRGDLSTLLNHFNGECIKAKAHAIKVGKKFGEKNKGGGERECPDWKNLLLGANPELNLPEIWGELPQSLKEWAWELHNKKSKGGDS